MNFKWTVLLAVLLFSIAINVNFAETTGSINISTHGNITPTTGVYGNIAPNTCSSNSECFEYKCFIDFDGTSEGSKSGWCNQTAITRCYHNGAGYAAGTYYCRTNTTYHICDATGNSSWGAQTSCASGQTCTVDATATSNPCAAASASSGSSGGGAGTSTNVSLKHSIKLVSGIQNFDIVQDESTFKYASFKNDGNLTLTNITLVLSGISGSWYGVNPPRFSSINPNEENRFNITFFLPKDAQVKSYQIDGEIKTHKSDVNAKFSFTIKVLPSNETVVTDLVPKYNQLSSLLQALEQNITVLSKGLDEANATVLKNLAQTIKSKLSEANTSLEKKDYFTANSLLSDAESLLNELNAKIAATKPAGEKLDIVLIAMVSFVIFIVVFVLYLFWPQSSATAKK